MENLNIQYRRNYYWKFGISPFKQNYSQEIGDAQVIINPIINNIEIPDDNVHVNNNSFSLILRTINIFICWM